MPVNNQLSSISRRQLLKVLSSSACAFSLSNFSAKAQSVISQSDASQIIQKPIPSTGELIPVIGMGTWITFNVGNNQSAIDNCHQVMDKFFEMGGSVIDSSPMYGSAEATLGKVFASIGEESQKNLFSASKIWTKSTPEGVEQFQDSLMLWNQSEFDLFQVHNLVNWKDHIATLKELKDSEKIRYLGITTSHGRRHEDFIEVMKQVRPDFIQVTYNVLDREVEKDILPLATDLGIAVLANRPFQGGRLFSKIGNQALPVWAAEIGCENWAQIFLKYVVSHPSITCAIPATSQVAHMHENMGAQLAQSSVGLLTPEFRKRIELIF